MYQILSTSTRDRNDIARMVPTPITSLRCAGGVALDIRPHIVGFPIVATMEGVEVPEAIWLPGILDARRPRRLTDRGE